MFSVRAFDNGVIHLDCGNVFSDGQPISSKSRSSKPIVNVVKVRIKFVLSWPFAQRRNGGAGALHKVMNSS